MILTGFDLPAEEEGTRDVTGAIPPVCESEQTLRVNRAVRLVVVAGTADLGRTFRVGAGPTVIGRGSTQVQLRGTDVSRSHARILPSDPDYVIEDMNSSNGTLLNGSRVTKPTRLRVGDRIQIGHTTLVFTHHDELEERVKQLQRVEAMTAFAGGLAHDFNNTLSIISANLSLLTDRGKADPELAELVAEMTGAIGDASALVKKMMRLGRSEPMTCERVRINAIVERAVAQARRVAHDNVIFLADVPDTLQVLGTAGELHQVLLNLFINARDAMPSGGTLTVRARGVELDRATALEEQVQEGRFVELLVRDTGCGMDEAVLARAFEPFFTTKAPGKGTGLGLAMIHQIVRGHSGAITATSTVGAGTEFRILLPRA